LETVGCEWNAFVLEDLAPRPLIGMPPEVLADMEDEPGLDLCGAGAAERIEIAHAD